MFGFYQNVLIKALGFIFLMQIANKKSNILLFICNDVT